MNRSSYVSFLLAGAALLAVPRAAFADQPPPVDVAIKLAPPPRRSVLVEWNPLGLFTIGRLSANLVVAPADHHALILSPFYAWTNTQPITVYSDQGPTAQLPTQHFEGFGGELGYRYYFGQSGPRGVFIGPSLILGWFQATAQNQTSTQYLQYGLAADVGYQMLVADRVSLSLGAGLQYTAETKDLPNQQFPAELYANSGLRPRVLLSAGWAF
jgi:hypothetical protein